MSIGEAEDGWNISLLSDSSTTAVLYRKDQRNYQLLRVYFEQLIQNLLSIHLPEVRCSQKRQLIVIAGKGSLNFRNPHSSKLLQSSDLAYVYQYIG